MAYSRVPADHTEFGGGRGMIDPEARKDRTLEAEQELIEIYATNPNDPESEPSTVDLNKRMGH